MKEEILTKIQDIRENYNRGATFSKYLLVPHVKNIFENHKNYLSYCKVKIIEFNSLDDKVYITIECENKTDFMMIEDFVYKYYDQSLIRQYTINNIIA